MDGIDIETLSGDALAEAMDEFAKLRVAVFRDYPYLYEGDVAHDRYYTEKYAASEAAVLVTARIGGDLVGASSALPLTDQREEVRGPLAAHGVDPEHCYYFGESILLPEYRGRGIGHLFFDEREEAAQKAGATHAAFCAVVREPDHPLRPEGYRPLDGFWRSRGYRPVAGVTTVFVWKEVGTNELVDHTMQYWMREL